MKEITHDHFLNSLKSNKLLNGYDETIAQKLPILQYYLKHFGPVIQVNNKILDFKQMSINPITNMDDWRYMNYGFNTLVQRYNNGDFKVK